MAIGLKLTNLFQFVTHITPFLVAFTFILIGILNYEPIKALIYIALVTVATFGVGLFKRTIDDKDIIGRSPMCDLWDIPGIGVSFNAPSLSTFFITFTTVYVLLPTIISGNINYMLMIFLIVLLVADTLSKYTNKCSSWIGITMGLVSGLVSGGLITTGLYYTYPDVLYFTERKSNNVVCDKKNKKTFKCVYINKKGEVVRTV